MKKFLVVILLNLVSIMAHAEIKISIYEHMKFRDINVTDLKDSIIGEGVLQIQADEEDYGKELEFVFVKKGMMTNRQNIIPIDNFTIDMTELDDKRTNKIIVDRKTRLIKFYATLDRRKISRKRLADELVEGKYVGAMPIMVSIYAPEEKKESK